jgi:hypothetical protein
MFLAALLLLFAASTSAQAPTSSREHAVFCGGETDVATVERYFSDLRRALTSSAPRTRFNAFVGHRFGIRNVRGRTLYFNLRDVGWITPGRISIEEWREISRRGARRLEQMGAVTVTAPISLLDRQYRRAELHHHHRGSQLNRPELTKGGSHSDWTRGARHVPGTEGGKSVTVTIFRGWLLQ